MCHGKMLIERNGFHQEERTHSLLHFCLLRFSSSLPPHPPPPPPVPERCCYTGFLLWVFCFWCVAVGVLILHIFLPCFLVHSCLGVKHHSHLLGCSQSRYFTNSSGWMQMMKVVPALYPFQLPSVSWMKEKKDKDCVFYTRTMAGVSLFYSNVCSKVQFKTALV